MLVGAHSCPATRWSMAVAARASSPATFIGRLVWLRVDRRSQIPLRLGVRGGEGGTGVARVAALHYYRDSRPTMVQPLHRNLSEIDLLVT
jgi:hypothetical protein